MWLYNSLSKHKSPYLKPLPTDDYDWRLRYLRRREAEKVKRLAKETKEKNVMELCLSKDIRMPKLKGMKEGKVELGFTKFIAKPMEMETKDEKIEKAGAN